MQMAETLSSWEILNFFKEREAVFAQESGGNTGTAVANEPVPAGDGWLTEKAAEKRWGKKKRKERRRHKRSQHKRDTLSISLYLSIFSS